MTDVAILFNELQLTQTALRDAKSEGTVLLGVYSKLFLIAMIALESLSRGPWTAFTVAGIMGAMTFTSVSNSRDVMDTQAVPAAALQCVPSEPTELVSGVFMIHCEENEPGATIEDGQVRVSLSRGTVGLFVDPERPEKKSVGVETPFGEVQVKGTLVSVRVDHAEARVEVFRGIVEVIPETEKHLAFQVAEGYGADLRHLTTFKLSKPATDMLITAIHIKPSAESDRKTATVMKRESSSVSSVTEDASEGGASADQAERSEQAEYDDYVGTDDDAERIAISIDTLIQDARSCLLVRDWECAEARYRKVLEMYSQSPESTVVLISLAKIELRHMKLPHKALAHYSMYLQEAPNGPLAEEALLGMANVYRYLGFQEQERKTLRRFVERFPRSTLLGIVRERLKQLGG
jgi:TolA-binding protein